MEQKMLPNQENGKSKTCKTSGKTWKKRFV